MIGFYAILQIHNYLTHKNLIRLKRNRILPCSRSRFGGKFRGENDTPPSDRTHQAGFSSTC